MPGSVDQSNVIVSQLNVAEAVKYRERYEADYCLLVGPGFAPRTTFASELQVHGVSAWTFDDLAAVVRAGFDSDRLRPLSARGSLRMSSRAPSGTPRTAKPSASPRSARSSKSIAARQQRVALAAPASEAPHLDVDAAMLILEEHFSAGNSPARCTRADVEAAFAGSPIPASAAAAGPTPNTNPSSSRRLSYHADLPGVCLPNQRSTFQCCRLTIAVRNGRALGTLAESSSQWPRLSWPLYCKERSA